MYNNIHFDCLLFPEKQECSMLFSTIPGSGNIKPAAYGYYLPSHKPCLYDVQDMQSTTGEVTTNSQARFSYELSPVWTLAAIKRILDAI